MYAFNSAAALTLASYFADSSTVLVADPTIHSREAEANLANRHEVLDVVRAGGSPARAAMSLRLGFRALGVSSLLAYEEDGLMHAIHPGDAYAAKQAAEIVRLA